MALRIQEVMSVAMIIMVMILGGANAQSSSCTNTLMGLSPCLNFVTGNTTTPSPSCCLQLSNVVQTQPRCLCSLLNGNVPNIGITINQTLAVTLPGACKVQTPPLSLCNGVTGAPAGAPASAPTSSAMTPTSSTGSQTEPSKETPAAQAPTVPSTSSSPSGSGSGSKATPSANKNAANGVNFGASGYLMLFVLFVGMKL